MNKKSIASILVLVGVAAASMGRSVMNVPAFYDGVYTQGLVVTENGAIVDGADISNSGTGPCLKVTGDNVTVRNSKIHGCKDHGILLLGVNNVLVENNEIWNTAMRNPPNTISGGWPSQIKVQSVDETAEGLAHHIIIRGNYVHHGYGEGMGLRGSYITVEGNTVQDNYSVGVYSNSDHTTVRGNFVLCTGDPKYNRDGLPMSGIGFAEETFANWGAHGHDSQVVINNVVEGCKYGFRYGASENGMGLANTVVAFNTFSNIKAASVSITYYANQSNVTVQNNLISSVLSMKNIADAGNVKIVFAKGNKAEDYRLTGPLPATGPHLVEVDYGGAVRSSPLDAGAWEFVGAVLPVTLTQVPASATATFIPTITQTRTAVPSATWTASPIPTFTQTRTAVPSATSTPECIYFYSHKETVCIQ